jgi:molybdopterin converting factor subunit 1
MMHTVHLFARTRDLAGADRISVELPPGSTVAELRQALALACPALAGLLARSAVALNGEFARDTDPVPEQAEISLLPPVSGG